MSAGAQWSSPPCEAPKIGPLFKGEAAVTANKQPAESSKGWKGAV